MLQGHTCVQDSVDSNKGDWEESLLVVAGRREVPRETCVVRAVPLWSYPASSHGWSYAGCQHKADSYCLQNLVFVLGTAERRGTLGQRYHPPIFHPHMGSREPNYQIAAYEQQIRPEELGSCPGLVLERDRFSGRAWWAWVVSKGTQTGRYQGGAGSFMGHEKYEAKLCRSEAF